MTIPSVEEHEEQMALASAPLINERGEYVRGRTVTPHAALVTASSAKIVETPHHQIGIDKAALRTRLLSGMPHA